MNPQTITIQNAQIYHLLFLQGIAAKEAGQYEFAAARFRALLSINPNHTPSRRALVDTLLFLGKVEAARFHLNHLYKTDPDPRWQNRYAKSLSDLLAKNPAKINGSLAFLPSTNVNHGTQLTNFGPFIIDASGRQRSGIGMRVGASGSYSWPVGLGQKLSLHSNLSAALYKDRALRHLDGEIGLSYYHQTPSRLLRIGPYLRSVRYHKPESGDISDMGAYGVTLLYQKRLSKADNLALDLRWEKQGFVEKDYLSGNYAGVGLTLGHRMNPSTSIFTTFNAQTYRPLANHQVYDDFGLSAGIQKRLPSGLSATMTYGVGRRDFEGDYPLLGSPRHDSYRTLGISVQHPKLVILKNIPQFGCTYRDNKSNVAFYDYDALDCHISMSRKF